MDSAAVGDLATRHVSVHPSTRCRDVDALFQADDQLRSVIVEGGGDVPSLVNRGQFYQLLTGRRGYGWSLYSGAPVGEILGRVKPSMVMDADRPVAEAGLELLGLGGLDANEDVLVLHPDGQVSQVAVSAILAELALVYATMVNQSQAAERRFRSLLHGSSDVIGVIDADARIAYLSAAAERIIGYPVGERVGRSAFELLHGDDVTTLRSVLDRIRRRPDSEEPLEFRLQRRDGEWRVMEGRARNLLHDDTVRGIVINFRDVTERHTLLEEIRHQAFHDSLTGLPNRQLIRDRAQQMLHRARRASESCAALLIDLDGFKDVNDLYGHGAGDDLLTQVAQRLRLSLRDTDTVGRLGGDEFVVLVEGSSLDAGPEVVAERILASFRSPFHLPDRQLKMSASVGVAVGCRDEPEHLLRDADIALYQAKNAGRNRYAIFIPSMKEVVERRSWLATELAGALDRNEFVLHFQPAFDLRDRSIRGIEALLRWKHPERGVIPPNDFIPTLESTGLIVPVGRWVLMESCRIARMLSDRGFPVPVAVNVSGRQLEDELQLFEDVRAALEQTGLPAPMLTLELTESILMRDAERTARQLQRLKDAGLQIAIDDFGTGYSSLSYLTSFPIDALKVDSSFVSNIGHSKEAESVLESVLNLGRALSLVTVAEGIEEDQQLQVLRDQGCDVGQGFKLALPLPVDELIRMLETASLVV